ncbi:MAG: hypothetical protein CL836_06665 [Crocinitomicaceae bacterium]|nr:hypothetical protein [Crocinitomicaceae bacterium]MEC9160226.1 DUF5683 domain-containing protein [Bacteroidota bacterium]|tara:strand:+ start:66 stop:644 length:579 start_codon:yes stop_codon:yes gene_type:complete
MIIRICLYFTLLIFLVSAKAQVNIDSIDKEKFIKRSTVLSSLIPAGGQVHNNLIKPNHIKSRIWWKVPVIYGGMATAAYYIYFNQNEFSAIRSERLDRQNGATPSLYPYYSSSQLKIIQEQYRRYRDISVISLLGVYLLQVIDANVEANLFLFDTDDNLSMQFTVLPIFTNTTSFSPALTLNYRFNNKNYNN